MPVSKQRKKATKKKKVVYTPCTDTNQHIKESNAEKTRQRNAIIKKIAEMKAKQELERRQHEAMGVDTSTQNLGVIDGLSTASE